MLLNNKVFIKSLEFRSPPLGSTGGRILSPAGELTQIVSGDAFRLLVYIEFQPNLEAPRGNHYHKEKEEFLYIVRGKLRAIYEDAETGEREEVIVQTGDLINIKPGIAHVYFPLEYTQSIEFSPNAFSQNDTFRYLIKSN